MDQRPGTQTKIEVQAFEDGTVTPRSDRLATEEPMEIRLRSGTEERTVAITMRTPGADFELAAGFLYGEGMVDSQGDVQRIAYCTDPALDADQQYNTVTVDLTKPLPDLPGMHRHFYTSSACGVCGKESLDALELGGCKPIGPGVTVDASTLISLPERLRSAQGVFESTGGLHAAGLFDPTGDVIHVREDVGRHNAVDKVIGRALLDGTLPLEETILMVSGRASYEILQKALVARIPIVCAVSAPSSLAVDVARRFEMTLVGFLRGRRFNVYADVDRVHADD